MWISDDYSIEHWTRSAIECYKRNCICQGCTIYEQYAKGKWKCMMKAAVIASVRKLGLPDELVKTDKENFLNE